MKLVSVLFKGLGMVGVAVALLVSSVTIASAFGPRVPQIGFNSASVQAYLNANDGGINALTDQVDGQEWTASVSGNATFTLMIELAGNAFSNNIGLYNANGPANPPLYLIFPGAASAGWHALAHFSGGNLTVTLFDQNSVVQGQNFYAAVNANGFGFYLDGPGGRFYSQDYRNGGAAQMLTYLGTGQNFGEWWECFEDRVHGGGFTDFDDAILLLQSVVPTPVNGSTWGKLKTLYRQ